MEKISWLDKVTNEEVLGRVNEYRRILNSVWQRKHRWICHVLRRGNRQMETQRKDVKNLRYSKRLLMSTGLASQSNSVIFWLRSFLNESKS